MGVHESLFIRVRGVDGRGIIIGNVYRPNTHPYENKAKSLKLTLDSLESARSRFSRDRVVLVGDFNIDLGKVLEDDGTLAFASELVSKGFKEHITRPTRLGNDSETIIDHIWTWDLRSAVTSGVIHTDISDHFSTFITFCAHEVKRMWLRFLQF